MGCEILPLRDYIELMSKGGYFSESTPYPELDPAAWRNFFAFRTEYPVLAEIEETQTYLFLEKYGFFFDPQDDERKGMNWNLSTSIIDLALPVTTKEFLQNKSALLQSIAAEDQSPLILTDTFMTLDGYPDESAVAEEGLVMLNSPVAEFYPTFAAYIESLNSVRRKKFRRLEKDYEAKPLRFELSQDPLSAAEMEFVKDNLEKRWGRDYLYALCQTLWSVAVSTQNGRNVWFMRVYDQDRLVFLQSLIGKGDTIYCQSIVKDEESHYDGIAAYTDFECIRALNGKGFRFFDPSCRTGLEDPESIGIAKRATINKNRIKPVFIAGRDASETLEKLGIEKGIFGTPL